MTWRGKESRKDTIVKTASIFEILNKGPIISAARMQTRKGIPALIMS